MSRPQDKVKFKSGHEMKNRFMLAPLTNTQSHPDGTLSDEEYHWLTMRAKGQFGIVLTCASHVQTNGQGFLGELGIYDDRHIAGHRRLAAGIKAEGSLAVIQLFHGGMRALSALTGEAPVSASPIERKGARGLSLEEVKALRDDFIAAAVRAKTAGYDGVELHGAHGYIIAQFISPEINQRSDEYGGFLENRSRLLFEIVDGIRERCGQDFLLGVRLSPERFGMLLSEVKELSQRLIDTGQVDFLDISLWDSFKDPEEKVHADKSLLAHFTDLYWGDVRLTVAGKIRTAQEVQQIIDARVDFVTVGRAAILHHDFPVRVIEDPEFEPIALPVSREYLRSEGLSDVFVDYMANWAGFVADTEGSVSM